MYQNQLVCFEHSRTIAMFHLELVERSRRRRLTGRVKSLMIRVLQGTWKMTKQSLQAKLR